MTPLSTKLNQVFPGRVVRKDLVQRVKKGTNVPTFVLEFLLARYCATDDPDEIEAGLQAVNETIQGNFVRPNESNAAQSLVQRNGTHKFIDKVRVVHKEAEKKHWAEMENFGSKRIAINEKHYRENQRLLEGGLWCEATIGYNTIEVDDYTFFVEEIRPIQISRFDFDAYLSGREKFTRDEGRDARPPPMNRNLVIVESPAKAKTIERYLGPGYTVLASYGHVRDLPENPGKNQLGVDVEHDFAPVYEVVAD